MSYENNYYESDREIVHTTAPGYVDQVVYPRHHHRRHPNGMSGSTVVTEVVAEQAIPGNSYGGYGHHRLGGAATEYVEREERVVENSPSAYGSYVTRPMY